MTFRRTYTLRSSLRPLFSPPFLVSDPVWFRLDAVFLVLSDEIFAIALLITGGDEGCVLVEEFTELFDDGSEAFDPVVVFEAVTLLGDAGKLLHEDSIGCNAGIEDDSVLFERRFEAVDGADLLLTA